MWERRRKRFEREEIRLRCTIRGATLALRGASRANHWTRKEIVEFADTRGADKIIYADYYPLGLTLERIFRELEDVPFREHVWSKFLRDNAIQALKL